MQIVRKIVDSKVPVAIVKIPREDIRAELGQL